MKHNARTVKVFYAIQRMTVNITFADVAEARLENE